MTKPISLVFDSTAHNGKINEIKAAAAKLVSDVQVNEPGVSSYQFFCDDATGHFCFLDTYTSSEALGKHLARPAVANAVKSLLANSEPPMVTVLGNVDSNTRKALSAWNPSIVPQQSGFTRQLHATAAI